MDGNNYLAQQNESIGESSFMKKLLKKRLNQKGLTLIELLAVIVILAIVAAIAIPAIGNIINDSRMKAAKSDALMIINAAQLADTNDATFSIATSTTDIAAASAVDNVPASYLESTGNFTNYQVYRDSDGDIAISGVWENGITVDFTGAKVDEIESGSADEVTDVIEIR